MDLYHLLVVLIITMLGIVMVVNMVTDRYYRRKWNDGICCISGRPWRLYYISDNGLRHYTDDEGNRTLLRRGQKTW